MSARRFLSSCVLISTLTTLLSAAPAPQGGKWTPFKARGGATSVTVTGGPPPAPLRFKIEAQGQATLLGRYTSKAEFVVRFRTPTEAVFLGGGTLTGANGDKLRFVMAGDFFPGPVPGGTGHFLITGGTGRFARAWGGGRFSSMANATTFDGAIRLRCRRSGRRGR